jgi:peptidyl-prolyl cis-trans isomerase C
MALIEKLAIALAAAGMLATCSAASAAAAGGTTNSAASAKRMDLFDSVVAKGKGLEIKRSDLDGAMISIKSAAAFRGQTIPPDQLAAIEAQVLERLVQIELLLAKATDTDKTAAKETTERRLEEIKSRAKGEEAFDRQLKSMGTSQTELRAKMTEEATAENVLERELKITVSDEEVKQFYDDNPAKFEQPEMARASHILFGTKDTTTGQDLPEEKKTAKRKQAEDVLKRAKAGEDFAKLAKEYSEDPGSKDTGGEYTFPRGQMVKEFEECAFSLQTNQVSDIVTTQFGYHIIKLSEKLPAKKLELAKVSPDIKQFLKQREIQEHQKDYQQYVDKLKQDAGVTILDEKLKPKPPAASAPEPAAGKK